MNSAWDRLQDWVLLIVLLVASLAILVLRNEPVMRSLRAGALEVTAQVEQQFAWVGGFLTAQEENERLRQENIRLASEVARSRAARLENEQMRRQLGFRDSTDLPLQPARIVARDLTRQENLLTLDVGRADSVQLGMPVVDERGIVGKVVLVSESYSRVMPYLNTAFRVPARIVPLGAAGIVRWDGQQRDRLVMDHVVRTEPVLPGQLVVTGASAIFPDGFTIGFVDSVSTATGRPELNVWVTPTAPLDRANYVFVVLRPPNREIEELAEQPVVPEGGRPTR